jgi:hypothetical protein
VSKLKPPNLLEVPLVLPLVCVTILVDTIPEEAFTAPTLKIRSICQGKCGKYYDKKASALGTFVLCDWMWGWLLRIHSMFR